MPRSPRRATQRPSSEPSVNVRYVEAVPHVEPSAPPSQPSQQDSQASELPEPGTAQPASPFAKARAEAEAETQAWLDRFKEHHFPLEYPAVLAEATRLLLQTLILEGKLDADETLARFCKAQTQMLRELFQQMCTQRDEAQLQQPSRQHQPHRGSGNGTRHLSVVKH